MKRIVQCFLFTIALTAPATHAITQSNYKTVEETFFNHSEANNHKIINVNVSDFRKLSEKEKEQVKKIKNNNPNVNTVLNTILKNEWSNNDLIYHFGIGGSMFLYPEKLKPQNFKDAECSYLLLFTDLSDCLRTYIGVKQNLTNVMKHNKIFIKEEYLADFLYIHELSHLLPQQQNIPEHNVTNVWVDSHINHYREIYSDLFAVIFLHNHLKYPIQDIKNVVLLREFKLHSNDDLLHYSIPYIEDLINDDNWKNAKSFEEIDIIIRDNYKRVSDNNIISKKSLTDIKIKNLEFCKNVKLSLVESQNIIDLLKDYCKRIN